MIHGDQFDGIVRYAKLARHPGRLGLHRGAAHQHRVQLGAPQARPAATGRCRPTSSTRSRTRCSSSPTYEHAVAERGAPPRRRRRGLRPHPSRRDPHHRRHPLLQRRRLGGELHRAGRGFRRPPAHRALGRGTRARAIGAAAPTRRRGWRRSRPDCASPSSPTPGDRRSTAWCAPSRPSSQLLQAEGHEVEVFGPDRFRTLPCPTYPEIRLSLFPAARLRPHAEAVRARRDPSRDRGAARLGGARLLPRARHPLHHRLSHALPRICARPHPPAARLELRLRAPLPCAVGGGAGGGAVDPRRARGARLQEPGAVVARRRHRRLQAAAARGARRIARPIWLYAGRRRGREEHQGLPRPRPARHQVGGGRRPAAQGAAAPLQGRALLRLGRHRGTVAPLRPGRLLRLPEPHRHVRPGDGRGAGLGRAGRGLSRARPARRRDHAQGRRPRRGPAHRLPRRRSTAIPPTAAPTPRPSPGSSAPSSSATRCARSRAPPGSPSSAAWCRTRAG